MTALVVACEEFDDGVSEVELSDVVTDWRCPTVTFDSMTAMVLDGSEVIAVGQVIAGRAEVDVLPSHRGGGVGSALLPFTWDVARRDGRITVGQTVSDGRTDAAPLFLGHGYIRRWTSWVFDIDVGDAAPPRLPDGYRLGELPPGDRAREVCHLIDTAFGEWPDWEGQDFDDWAAQTLEHERFVAAPSPIIVHEGRLVGVAINSTTAPRAGCTSWLSPARAAALVSGARCSRRRAVDGPVIAAPSSTRHAEPRDDKCPLSLATRLSHLVAVRASPFARRTVVSRIRCGMSVRSAGTRMRRDTDRTTPVKRMLRIAGLLIALAVVLAVIGLVLRALRWLVIVAAVVLVIGAIFGYRGRSGTA